MSIVEYISDLRRKHGILVTVSEEGNLTVKAKKQESLTPEIVGELKQRKQAILDFYKTIKPNEGSLIEVAPRQDHYPLSYAQRRLWVLDQLVEDGGLYNVPLRYRFPTIDIALFQQSFKMLLDRHEILRTVIRMVNGEPRQFIMLVSQMPWEIESLQVSTEELNPLLLAEARYRLDLDTTPWKARLFILPNQEVVFSLVLHHVVTDGWSVKVLSRDFNKIYEALVADNPQTLNPLPFQYKDYTLWQKDRINQGALLDSKKHWHGLFQDFETAIDLPRDKPRGTEKHIGGSQIILNFPPAISERLMEIGNGLGASFFMVCTSVIYTLIYRYTGSTDITLGTPITGRDHPELKDQVGYYSNTVVLRNELDPDQGFKDLLKKVYKVVLEAMEHQFYPFDLLVEELNIERDNSRNPLFDVMISYHDDDQLHEASQETEEVTMQDGGFNKFDLTFDFKKTRDHYLKVLINYDDYLFGKARMLRLSEHLKELITAITTHPDLALHQLTYFGEGEQQQLIAVNQKEWKIEVPGGIKVLFENQARQIPNQTALLSKKETLTFSQLNDRANWLAHYLINKYQIAVGDKVAISLEPGIPQVMAMLAIIKIGATYVPIDMDQPDSRLQFIMQDTQSKLVVSEQQHEERLAQLECSTVVLDNAQATIQQQDTDNPQVETNHDHLAILYTSGTTGVPKGVILTEKGIVNRMAWLWQARSFGIEDVIYQKTNFLFDVSIGEIFMPLCFGAKLLVETSNTSKEILANVEAFRVTYIHFSCTQLNHFLNSITREEDQKLASLRYVFSSGEAVQRETVNHFYQRFDIPLINLYGPTEASIEVSYFETKAGEGPVPIGRPIANVQLYVLDEHLHMTGIGIPGEVYIAGVCLAHAYLNRKDLTDERFLPNPFGKPGEKMFRTGDFGCWNDKMQLEFLGRKDRQISINGSRIELDGIVSQILAHEEVQEATISVEKDQHDNYHLHAFYVRKPEEPDIEDQDEIATSSSVVLQSKELYSGEQVDYRITQRIEQYVLNNARSNPEKVAIQCQGSALTYGELDHLSAQLADQLVNSEGVKPGAVVAISMRRSHKAIVAMLAILRAGAVYLPIDPDYPSKRVKYMLSDSAAQMILLDKETTEIVLPESLTILVYEDLPEVAHEPNLPTIRYSGEDLCYLCYTSGSTGKPKGVKVAHASVTDYVLTFTKYFGLSPRDKVLQQASLSFDTSVEEIFPALCCGATVVIQPDGGQDIAGIIQAVNTESISVLSVTPMILHQLNLLSNEFEHYPRTIISGGDILRPSDLDQLIHYTSIYNTYGPTETTVCAAFGKVEKASEAGIIGRPIVNHAIYLLDESMNLVEPGETGEIFIAGNGVAQGYLNNDQETNHRFVMDSFQGGIMYKTGDLARWTADGRLVYQGREDNQVKVRGYRIELSEIDHQLAGHPRITDVVSIVKAGYDGVKKIIAYYKSDAELSNQDLRAYLEGVLPIYMIPGFFIRLEQFPRNINHKLDARQLPIPASFYIDHDFTTKLKSFLRKSLPAYMLPSHFIPLEEMPTTVSGKINQKALKQLSGKFLSSPVAVIAPRNETEKAILKVWQDCLKQTEISVEANFFELGGDSIKAMQIVAGVTRKLHREIALRDIMNFPTIAGLAEQLNRIGGEKSLKVRLNKHQPNLPMGYFIPPITGSSTIFQSVSGKLEGILNCIGLQYPGFESARSEEDSIERLAETLAEEIDETQEIILVGYSMGAVVAFEMAKLLEAKGVKTRCVLIDRGPHTKDGDLSDEALHQVVDRELRKGLGDMGEELMTRTKDFILHNNSLLANYKPSGKVSGPFLTIEATQNKIAANAREWEHYSAGDFSHEFVPTHHYGILAEAFEKPFADLLKQFINPKRTAKHPVL